MGRIGAENFTTDTLRVYNEKNELLTEGKEYAVIFDENSSLEITARSLTLTAASAIKVYDGSPLTAYRYTVTWGSLVDGHTDEAVIDGSIIEIGSTENIITVVVIRDASGADVTGNYKITTVAGQLTVIG